MKRGIGKRLAVKALAAAMGLTLAAACGACSDNESGGDQTKRVTSSTGEFNRGYKDGQRDAKWSLSDMSGGWMWLWMTDKEYQQGYDRGWRDGREAAKLEAKRDQQQGEVRKADRAPKLQSSEDE